MNKRFLKCLALTFVIGIGTAIAIEDGTIARVAVGSAIALVIFETT